MFNDLVLRNIIGARLALKLWNFWLSLNDNKNSLFFIEAIHATEIAGIESME